MGGQPSVLDHLALHICLLATENSLEPSQLSTCQVSGLHQSPKPHSLSFHQTPAPSPLRSQSVPLCYVRSCFPRRRGSPSFLSGVLLSCVVCSSPVCRLLSSVCGSSYLLLASPQRGVLETVWPGSPRKDGTQDPKERCLGSDKDSRS